VALLSLSTMDPLLPLPGDCTCAVTPFGIPVTLAVSEPFDPDRVTVIEIAAVFCPGKSVAVPLPTVNANCGPVVTVPPELPHPTATGSASRIKPILLILAITNRKATTKTPHRPLLSGTWP
jgi:hypothetical protein